MRTDEFNSCLDSYKQQIDAELKAILSELDYPDDFKSVLDYALFPSGKRLRPVLMLAWHNLFSPADGYALRYACGIEILHSYSLIHDDMPCMDNDDYRRGKPTVHKMYGEGKALLAGDALLDLAYRILGTPTPHNGSSPFWMYSSMCGDSGLIHGQYSDLYGKIDDLSDLLKMYEYKTGALIKLACLSGCALGNDFDVKCLINASASHSEEVNDADETSNDRKLMNQAYALGFGEAFGKAFQLYDDISEYIGGERVSQTSVINYVELDDAKRMLNSELNAAARILDEVGGDTQFLRELLSKFIVV